jgi:hypothetical protein
VYLDYTGGGLYAESQLRDHMALLSGHVFGNPHSKNLTSMEVDMHKVLQVLIDTIRLAAGAVELGSAAHSPANTTQGMSQRATTQPLPHREPPTERVGRSEPQPFVGEPALRTNPEKGRP